ncbi:hypothetical protein SAMN05216436_1218 [bacterium A37T11]|nr:hypothetical protein SAMN05216436_1218 [bacterium A37T11]
MAGSFRYDFENLGGHKNSYVFITKANLVYEIRFTATPYLFGEDLKFADYIYLNFLLFYA